MVTLNYSGSKGKDGDIVYLKSEFIEKFVEKELDKIDFYFILVTCHYHLSEPR